MFYMISLILAKTFGFYSDLDFTDEETKAQGGLRVSIYICMLIHVYCSYTLHNLPPEEIIISLFCLNVAGRRIKRNTFTDLLNLPLIRMKNASCDQVSWVFFSVLKPESLRQIGTVDQPIGISGK